MNLKKHLESKKAKDEYKKFEDSVKRGNLLGTALLFKQYIYSYLTWLHEQNPEYATQLQPEELSNYFLHNLEHPTWFKILSERLIDNFKFLCVLNDTISKYLGEDIFEYRFPIIPKDKHVQYSSVVTAEQEVPGDFLKLKLKELSEATEYKLSGVEINNMNLATAEATLSVFGKLQKQSQ